MTPRPPAGSRVPPPAVLLAVLVALGVAAGVVAPSARARDRERPSSRSLEAETHERVNEHRRAAGLPALDYRTDIAAIARRHSEAMAAGAVPFGHAGVAERRRRILRSVPLQGMAENVGFNNAAARRAARLTVSGWLESPGHRANIEGDYDATGIGIARSRDGTWYFTQIFVKRSRDDSFRPAPR